MAIGTCAAITGSQRARMAAALQLCRAECDACRRHYDAGAANAGAGERNMRAGASVRAAALAGGRTWRRGIAAGGGRLLCVRRGPAARGSHTGG